MRFPRIQFTHIVNFMKKSQILNIKTLELMYFYNKGYNIG